MAVTPKGRALGIALRNARERRGMSLRVLAAKIDKHCGEISRWENGERSLKPDRVAQVLGVLGVSGAEYDDIVSLAHGSKNQAWMATTLPEREQQMSALVDFERNANTITAVAPLLVPGLLQEPSYTRAIMVAGRVPEPEIPGRVAMRMNRKKVITGSDPVTFSAFIGEAVLHQMVGEPQVMANQLRHLLEMHEHLNVQIRVVPYRAGWSPALEGSFTLIEPHRSGTIVQLDNRRSTLYLHDTDDIRAYQDAVEQLRLLELSTEHTNRLMRKCLERWENMA